LQVAEGFSIKPLFQKAPVMGQDGNLLSRVGGRRGDQDPSRILDP
jgi:hypothetical protein